MLFTPEYIMTITNNPNPDKILKKISFSCKKFTDAKPKIDIKSPD